MPTTFQPTTSAAATMPRTTIAAIIAFSATASAFLFWLLYFHHAPTAFAQRLTFLPALNAVFNGLSASSLVIGLPAVSSHSLSRKPFVVMTNAFPSHFPIEYPL